MTDIATLHQRLRDLQQQLELARSQERGAKAYMLQLSADLERLRKRIKHQNPEVFTVLKEAERLRAENLKLQADNMRLAELAGFERKP